MDIILKQNVYRIKNGFAASTTTPRLTAHGSSPELAKLNLENLIYCFLKPFERQGTLEEELAALQSEGVQISGDGTDIKVTMID